MSGGGGQEICDKRFTTPRNLTSLHRTHTICTFQRFDHTSPWTLKIIPSMALFFGSEFSVLNLSPFSVLNLSPFSVLNLSHFSVPLDGKII